MTISAAVTGNLGDVDLKFTPSGVPCLNLSIAVNHGRYDKEAKEFNKTGTTWIRATLWEAFAEQAADVLKKGQRVTARGRLETREYTTKDGNPGTAFEMLVDDIGPAIGKRPQGGGERAPQQPAAQPAADPWGQQQGGWGGAPSGGSWDAPSSQPAF